MKWQICYEILNKFCPLISATFPFQRIILYNAIYNFCTQNKIGLFTPNELQKSQKSRKGLFSALVDQTALSKRNKCTLYEEDIIALSSLGKISRIHTYFSRNPCIFPTQFLPKNTISLSRFRKT